MSLKDMGALIDDGARREKGEVLVWERADVEVIFVTLEVRHAKSYITETRCLVLFGTVHGRGPGSVVFLKGIIDMARKLEDG